MRISDTTQKQAIYDLDLMSIQEKENKTVETKKVLENAPAAEISISKEGMAALEEAARNRTGCFGIMTGQDDFRKMPRQGPEYEIFFEHLWELGEAMSEAEKKYNNQGDGVNYFMLTLAEGYEMVYRNIVEQHKDGNREVEYEIAGKHSLSLEEDVAGLDAAYDFWLKFVDAYVLGQQRLKAMTSHSTDLAEREQGQKKEEKEEKYMSDEYNEYRHNVINIMRRGREDFLATFRALNENTGIMTGIMSRLMGLTAGFWEKTNVLWS